ncbi:MAG: hypothetical protein M3O36_19825, partial [Myxococcota bacterium]|nr:hypothetical protein [Myxococcota bacterium]
MAKRTGAGWGETHAAPSRPRTSMRAWVFVVGLAAVAGAGSLAWLDRRSAAPVFAPVGAPLRDAADEPEADWCAPGFEPIA